MGHPYIESARALSDSKVMAIIVSPLQSYKSILYAMVHKTYHILYAMVHAVLISYKPYEHVKNNYHGAIFVATTQSNIFILLWLAIMSL